MKKIGIVRCMIVGALVSAYAAGAAAQAISEVEPNYPDAQPLVRGADGTMSVKGVIGVSEFFLPIVDDVDLYSFFASEGDVLQIDIDGGIKSSTMFGAPRSVDTTLTILGPDTDAYPVKREQATCLAGTDPGSISPLDPCILNFRVEKSGIYIVAVTASPARVFDGGHVDGSAGSNGEYLLIVSGASEFVAAQAVQVINIEIKPGSRQFAPVNLKSKGSIPVALLSSAEFDALKVDRESITFGATGDEQSLRRCGWQGEDVNGDTRLDLVCHFDNQLAKFGPDDLEGVLKGTIDGKPFEGRGVLKVLLGSKKQK